LIVLTNHDPVLVDREALMMLTGRSVHTIRLRCAVYRYRGKRPLYDLHRELARLAAIPTRQRRADRQAS
jgi:hypothetical protein